VLEGGKVLPSREGEKKNSGRSEERGGGEDRAKLGKEERCSVVVRRWGGGKEKKTSKSKQGIFLKR